VDKLRAFKDRVIQRLTGGVNLLLSKRGVTVVRGKATFEDSRTVHIEGDHPLRLRFKHAIIATGSRPKRLPEKIMPADCCMDSTGALLLEEIPKRLLVVGGGYIGLELGQVYAALGSQVSVVEMMDSLLPGVDADLVKPLAQNLNKQLEAIHLSAKLKSAKRSGKGVDVTFEVDGKDRTETFDRVLVSVGRQPITDNIGLERTGVQIDQRGFIIVDEQRRTLDKRIFAIGDVAGEPMLAHKAMREAKVAVEAIAGRPAAFDNTAIPARRWPGRASPRRRRSAKASPSRWCGLAGGRSAGRWPSTAPTA
jgi:dihydrolipoamide dehydrogenase